MYTKRYLALVMALVMVFSLVVPASAVETLAQNGDETAKLTVSANVTGKTQDAAVGTIFSNMNAKLVLYYGDYLAQNTVNIVGQTKDHANQTTLSLGGTAGTGIDFFESSIETYFPGFDHLYDNTAYAIQFVDKLGEAPQNWDYSFKKTSDNDGVTLEVLEVDDDTTEEVDGYWQALKGEAFTVTHNNNPEDSYIKLAAGSYLQLDTEKLTVNSDLKLDDFSNETSVDANIDNAKAKLTYTDNSTPAYQLLLKEGTQFSLGKSIATVKQDLLVTMTGVNKNYDLDAANGKILGSVYNNLTKNTEENLAKSLLVVFSDIAGLVGSQTGSNPVVITFGTPNSTTTTEGNTTVITTTTENAAGTTDVTTVETTTISETTDNTRTTTETVVTSSSTVTQDNTHSSASSEKYTVSFTSQKVVTTTTYENDVQTEQVVAPVTDSSKEVTVTIQEEQKSEDVSSLSQASGSVNIADAELDNLTSSAKAALVTEAVTKAQDALQTEQAVENVTVSLAIVAEAKNSDSEAENQQKKTYEVKPVVTTTVTYTSGDPFVSAPSTVSNDSLKGDEISITLPVPDALVNEGKLITVTHRSEDLIYDTFQVPVFGSAGAYYVTFTVTHFSQFDLEPVVVAETGTATVAANLTLEDDIAINFHVWNLTQPASYYSAHYSFNGETEKVVPLSSITPVDGEYSITVASCAAKQMADEVHFELYCGDTSIDSYDYSIRNYCLNKINYSSNASLVALCRAVLNYGASAQSYFNYNVNHPANEGISTSSPEDVPADYNNISVNVSSGINPRANMTLVSKTELNFELDGLDTTHLGSVVVRDVTDSNAVTVIDEARLVKEEGTNYYAVKVKGIPAKYLNHVFELSYEYFGTQETVRYSPMTYAYRNQNKTTYGLGDLCRAMYGYWQAAAAYLPNN